MKFSLLFAAAPMALAVSMPAAAETSAEADDRILVTGSPLEREVQDALVGVSILDGEELERNLAASIGETLRREPGISTTSFGAGASRPIIRGLGGDRVRVLDNGIGSIDASASSPDHAVPVEPAQAQRIEIVRGASVLRYGSSGAGGVVNVLDGRIPLTVPEDNIDLALRAGASTVDEGRDLAGALTMGIGKLGDFDVVAHIDGTVREANDYDIPGFAESAAFRALEEAEEEEHDGDDDHDHEEEEVRDTLENSFSDTRSGAAGLSFIGSKSFLGFSFKTTESTYGLPGGHEHEEEEEGEEHGDEEEHGEEEEEGVFIDLTQHRYDLKGGIELDSGFIEALNLSAGYADYKHTEFESPTEAGTVFRNEGWEARLEAVQRTQGAWRGATGIHVREREFSAVGAERFVDPTDTTQWALYTFQEWSKDALTLEGALRYENTEHKNTDLGVTRDFDAFSASAGAAYDVSDAIKVGGTVFRTERAPITEELFSNGPHIATGQFEIGDPDLDKEIATGIEGIFRLQGERGSLVFTAFYTDYQDYIFDALTGEEEDGLPVFQFGSADAEFAGFEVEGAFDIAEVAGFSVSTDGVVDFVDASIDLDGNDNLPRIPPLGATVGVNADSEMFGSRLEVEYAGEQDEVANFELPTDSYTLLNAYLSWYPMGRDGNLSLNLQGLNLTDEEARVHTSFLKDEIPLPGRNVRFSVRLTY